MTALAIACGPGGVLTSGGEDGRLRVWQANGEPAFEIALGDHVYSVAFAPGSTSVFAGDWQGRASAVDVKARKAVLVTTPSAPSS